MNALRLFFGRHFRFKKVDTLTVGQWKLRLDLSKPHERRYSVEGFAKNIDYLVADEFVRPGMSVLDLGGNIGLTALFYIKCGACLVDVFEPDATLAQRIRSIGCPSIRVHEVAVADCSANASMWISDAHNQGNSLNPEWPRLFPHVFTRNTRKIVQTVSLDAFFQSECFDFIKIDVEGLEDLVLRGGEHFFDRCSEATVQIEIYDDLFERTNKILKRYFSCVSRVQVNSVDGSLTLTDPSQPLGCCGGQFMPDPPTYICRNV